MGIAQLPLYTLWHEGSTNDILFAVVQCTGGDIIFASLALLGALLIVGDPRWPQPRFHAVAAVAILGGLAYTVFSEWLNTEIRGSWAYTEAMPQLPFVGAGISPLAQWIVIPLIAFWWIWPSARSQLAKVARSSQNCAGRAGERLFCGAKRHSEPATNTTHILIT